MSEQWIPAFAGMTARLDARLPQAWSVFRLDGMDMALAKVSTQTREAGWPLKLSQSSGVADSPTLPLAAIAA